MHLPDDLEVEVQSHTNNAWYKAWIIDIYHTTALCYFGWKSDQIVPLMRIRLPPKYAGNHQYCIFEEVEVLSPEVPRGWWPAVIEQVSSDRRNYSIKYQDLNDFSCKDIVGRDRIRPLIKCPPIHAEQFLKHSIEVSDKLRDSADVPGVLDDKAFKKFKDDTGASLIRYDKSSNSVVVLTPHVTVLRTVEHCLAYLLARQEQKVEMFLRNKRYNERLKTDPDAVLSDQPPLSPTSAVPPLQLLQQGGEQAAAGGVVPQPLHQIPLQQQFTDEFTISPNFMGLAIGVRGKNINEARKIPGIISLDLNEEDCTFTITGESREAVSKAREHLEHGELIIKIGQDITPRIIGKKGNTIRDIIHKANCVRVKVDPDLDTEGYETGHTKFTFVGTLKSLKHAKILINCQINYIKEMMEMNSANMKADEELRKKLGMVKLDGSNDMPIGQDALILTPRAPVNITSANEIEGKNYPTTPNGPVYQKSYSNTVQYTVTMPNTERLELDPEDKQGRHSQHQSRVKVQAPAEKVEEKAGPLQPRVSRENTREVPRERSIPRGEAPKEREFPREREQPREQPRETYRTRDLTNTRRPSPSNKNSLARATTPKTATTKKPKVDIKLVNEKIGSALGDGKKQLKSEDLRSEQQAAIEDLVKAEASTVTQEEDKENQKVTVNNQNLPMDNSKHTNENDNLTKSRTVQANELSHATTC